MSKETTWQRRKDRNVKPNIIVRSIYNTVDWLGEFSGIVNATKRGTGYFIAVTVSTLITLSILIASIFHSIELLEHAGLHSGLQYVMLLPFEIMFLTSSSALNKSITQGKYFPIAPWAGFLVSIVFIWRSNVIGLADNIDGQVLAWSTPFLLLISKGILAWTVKNRKATTSKKEKQSKKVDEPATKSTVEIEQSTVQEIEPIDEKSTVVDVPESTTGKLEKSADEMIAESTVEEKAVSPTVSTEKAPSPTVELEVETTTAKPTESATKSAPKKRRASTTKPTTRRKKQPPKEKVAEVAQEYEKQHGELPGRPTLSKLAKCSLNRAREVLVELNAVAEKANQDKPKLELVAK